MKAKTVEKKRSMKKIEIDGTILHSGYQFPVAFNSTSSEKGIH